MKKYDFSLLLLADSQIKVIDWLQIRRIVIFLKSKLTEQIMFKKK
jgi:hypothetical protein